MKKTFFAIVMMVVIALTSSMSARTVNGNTNDFEACKAYLAENPNDTIQGQDGRIVFLGSDGRVKRQAGFTAAAPAPAVSVVTSTSTEVVNAAGKQYKRVSSVSELSDGELEAINSGEVEILDTHCRDFNGNNRQHIYIGAYGGARVGEATSPLAGVRFGYECSKFLYELDVHYVIGQYADNARAHGERFNSLGLEARVGYKFLTDRLFKKSLAFVLGAGGEHQETDKDKVGGKSQNLALVLKAGFQGQWSLTDHIGLFGGLYFGNVPFDPHNSWQELQHFAGSAEAGVRCTF